jgi:Starch-binding associating with outer membrane
MTFRNIITITVAIATLGFAGCKKYLDINSDPDTPQFPDPVNVFPTQLASIPRGLQFDARYCLRYTQMLNSFNTSASAVNVNFDRHGYAAGSDANGDIWRQTYFGNGQNLIYNIKEGQKRGQWDVVGASLALEALMFQYCTDYHGEIIFTEAFRDQAFFKFDDQELVYQGIDSICRMALRFLNRTDYEPSSLRLSRGDYSYNGDVARWKKLVYGVMARNWHHLTNKPNYNADSVIKYCDSSMVTINDDFLIPFDASKNDDANFFGTFRDNMTVFRQSNYIVRLLDGSTLAGNSTIFNRDPRLRHMLVAGADTTNGNGGYRGVDPATGDPFDGTTTGPNSRRRVPVPFGDSLYRNEFVNNFSTSTRKYVFGDKVVFPVMTLSEIKFIKAEAMFRKGDKTGALTAFREGINAHFDFINRGSFPRSNNLLYNTTPISATERADYLARPYVNKTITTLTLTDIMLQKYIALWGWGCFETFVDMRRYHYTDPDPATGLQVYLGLALPNPFFANNFGKPVYRVRPRFNSEYVWNVEELRRIGALNLDYHTYETWFSKP